MPGPEAPCSLKRSDRTLRRDPLQECTASDAMGLTRRQPVGGGSVHETDPLERRDLERRCGAPSALECRQHLSSRKASNASCVSQRLTILHPDSHGPAIRTRAPGGGLFSRSSACTIASSCSAVPSGTTEVTNTAILSPICTTTRTGGDYWRGNRLGRRTPAAISAAMGAVTHADEPAGAVVVIMERTRGT